MVERQKGLCAICEQPEKGTNGRWGKKTLQLAVDHNHETSKVRGLLCRRCNQGLGKFEDNPELLEKAASYLKNEDTHYNSLPNG